MSHSITNRVSNRQRLFGRINTTEIVSLYEILINRFAYCIVCSHIRTMFTVFAIYSRGCVITPYFVLNGGL